MMYIEQNEENRIDDYIGEDGLLYCGRCHTRKEFKFSFDGKEQIISVCCECEKAKRIKADEERILKEKMEDIQRMRATWIHDRALIDCRFENDDGSVNQLKSAKWYVDTWEERKARNDGLILWGDVGTGKTFYAACIANSLIDRGEKVLMTNFSKILNKLRGMYVEDKNEFIAGLMSYSLLIIDDFGIERDTDYAKEQVYNIIDERYKTKMPLILTTNLNMQMLKNPVDLMQKRIYDRIFSMCVPIRFYGTSHRKLDENEKKEFYKKEMHKWEEY